MVLVVAMRFHYDKYAELEGTFFDGLRVAMKSLAKALIRQLVYARLRWAPLTEASALWWANIVKRWPAIFMDSPYAVNRKVRHGALMKLGIVDVIERSLLVHGTWDEGVADVMRACIRPDSTVVDVGANVGYFSLLAASIVGDEGRVVCIEPSHRNLIRLCENLWMNRCRNVFVLSLAAGVGNGCAAVAFPTYNNAGAASLRKVNSVQEQKTFVVALDDVFEAHSIVPDFIKLDVEGFELQVLTGLERTLQKFSPVLVCELTDSFLRDLGQSAAELLIYMERLGYECALATSPSGAIVTSRDVHLLQSQIDVVFRKAGC